MGTSYRDLFIVIISYSIASLGIKNDIGVVSNDQSSNSSNNKTKLASIQQLEDLTDDVKQRFIRDYKTQSIPFGTLSF